MEKSVGSWKTSNENIYSEENGTDFRCGECGEEFHKPLLARMSNQGLVQTYYACPRCLTRVPESRHRTSEKTEGSPISLKDLRASAKLEENASCQHFFGYLGKRPKDTAIPEDCLTCDKMIECMIH
jgi:predicted RNA-binding Zn-ribbon protein involved in translation (DUF1610 family)